MADEWIDVSVPVHAGMVHWPGDPEVKLERVQSIAKGDEANLTRIDMSAHTGTHMDAPLHFFEDDPGMEAFPLEIGMGRARVIGIEGKEPIDRGPLEDLDIESGERVLFRTVNSERAWWERDFDPDFVYVSYEAAELLGEIGVALVGVDYLSVGGPGNEGGDVHRALLGAGAWVVEGLDLSAVEPGDYELICLPIKLVGSDGAPARVLLSRRARGSAVGPGHARGELVERDVGVGEELGVDRRLGPDQRLDVVGHVPDVHVHAGERRGRRGSQKAMNSRASRSPRKTTSSQSVA